MKTRTIGGRIRLNKINVMKVLESVIEQMANDFYKVMKANEKELISEFLMDLKDEKQWFNIDTNLIKKWEEKLK